MIGAEIVRRLSAEGYAVAIHGRSVERAERLRDSLTGDAEYFTADLADEDEVVDMYRSIRERLGTPAVLVNAAYPRAADEPCRELSVRSIAAHLSGITMTALSCKHAIDGMQQQGGGRIVNLSAALASRVHPGLSLFGAVSAGLIAFSRALALEVGPGGTTVNVVAPGRVEPDSASASSSDPAYAALERLSRSRAALGWDPSPADVADAVLHLLSAGARALTGQVLYLAAGESL